MLTAKVKIVVYLPGELAVKQDWGKEDPALLAGSSGLWFAVLAVIFLVLIVMTLALSLVLQQSI